MNVSVGRKTVAAMLFGLAVGHPLNAAEIFTAGTITEHGVCDVVIMGTIEASDDLSFRQLIVKQLRAGCNSPRIHLYSRGGNLHAAMKIGDDIHHLQVTTIAPMLYFESGKPDELRARNGPRICQFLPGSAERGRREQAAAGEYSKAFIQALRADTTPPKPPQRHGDYDPTSGIGDPRCSCGSACFFVWAAGSERRGDVVEIHRPIFEPKEYAHLGADAARAVYETLMRDTREYLNEVGVQASLIDRMYSIESSRASYLSAEDLKSWR